jgi:glutathione S-transferase
MLKLYGTSQSRTVRCLWALGEMGLKFEHIPTKQAETHTPAHLKLNPNGHIPVLDDDGLVLFESLAINMYLAEKYGRAPLWPASNADRGALYQWTLWSQTEVEWAFFLLVRNRILFPPEKRSEEVVQQAIAQLETPFAVLESHLGTREYMLGKEFTLADLNLASVMRSFGRVGVDTGKYAAMTTWLQKCLGREAYQNALKMP